MKSNVLIIISLILCSALFCFFWTVYHTPPEITGSDTIITTKIDTFWKDTTITEKEFVPKYIYKLKTDTFYTKEGNDTIFETENKIYKDTLKCAEDTVILTSYISGVNAALDSINLNLKKSETIITNTVEITKYIEKKKTFWDRFHISVQGGYGYSFKGKELTPYAGVGGSFDL